MGNLNRFHHSWLTELQGIAKSSTQIPTATQLMLSDISLRAATAKTVLDAIDFDSLRKQANVSQLVLSETQLSVSNLAASYRSLTESIQSAESLFELPHFVLPGAIQEVTNTGYALDALHPQLGQLEIEDSDSEAYQVADHELEDYDFVAMLEKAGPQCVAMYRGAVTALMESNPDRARHVLTSLRELWNHLLRTLAPSRDLEQWIADNGDPKLIDNGKPTRYAKIRYVLKELSDDPLVDFVEADTNAMVKLYNLFGHLHRQEPGITDEQLRVIVLRSKSYLDYILRAWVWSKE